MVTHSPGCARYAGRILHLKDGCLDSEEKLSSENYCTAVGGPVTL
jgi:ABC-type lipoprotein export system ATPase subunit